MVLKILPNTVKSRAKNIEVNGKIPRERYIPPEIKLLINLDQPNANITDSAK